MDNTITSRRKKLGRGDLPPILGISYNSMMNESVLEQGFWDGNIEINERKEE
jgi:hypothetical protein